MGFREFILARDAMGHTIGINYKGNGAHTTYVGAMVTMVILIFVLVQLMQSLDDLINMESPNILSFMRPIYDYEQEDMGAINLAEHNFFVGVYFSDMHSAVEVPEEFGRMVTETLELGRNDGFERTEPAIKCSSAFNNINMNIDHKVAIMAIENGHCADLTSEVKGN